MTPLWEQKLTLVDENSRLIRDWLALLDEDKRLTLIASLVDGYSLPQLRVMNAHIKTMTQERTS